MSKFISTIKNYVKSALYEWNNLLIPSSSTSANPALILNYHHILPSDFIDNSVLNGYSHSTKSFEAQMKWMSNRFHQSTNFDDKNSFIVTFDDCSVSTFEEALPILNDYNIKAYFFVVENSLSKALWIDKYFFWLSYVPSGKYRILNKEVRLSDHKSRLVAHQILWGKYESGTNSEHLINALESAYSYEHMQGLAHKHRKRLTTITEKHIESLKSRGHYVGFHSRSHEKLSKLEEHQLNLECTIQNPSLFNTDVFAIPFGGKSDYNKSALDLIKSKGFHHILLNHPTQPVDGCYGRLNLPDTGNRSSIEFHVRRYLKSIQ